MTTTNSRDTSIGYLRTFITLLVVAHHAALAYHPYAPAPPKALNGGSIFWAAFPVVDRVRMPGADLLVAFNDLFFMSLMFFVSGLFVWSSLQRKGSAAFVRDRMLRLGIPFVISAALLAPLAYYPTYLRATSHATSFWYQWLHIGSWPAGPAWFLWVLLAFGCIAALLSKVAPRWGETLGRITGSLSTRPFVYYLALIAVSALAYLPMARIFDPMDWMTFGPFVVQKSRFIHYAVYFFAGAGVGAFGLGRGLLARDGKLARRWLLWAIGSLIAFAFALAIFITIFSTLAKGGPGLGLATLGNFAFVVSCATTSLACIAFFTRFVQKPNSISNSLTAAAYGVYIFHYAAVSWLQLALLPTSLTAAIKFLLVFAGATAISWMVTAALRRIPIVARVL